MSLDKLFSKTDKIVIEDASLKTAFLEKIIMHGKRINGKEKIIE